MTDASEWTGRVGTAWAEEWQRTDRSFGALTDRLLDQAALGVFTRVLDIGCGAGEVSLRLAERNPRARVLGVDISPELLDVARRRGAKVANVRFSEADAAMWKAGPGEHPDLLISRHGVMFFADPTAGFAHLRNEARAAARLRFSCFRAHADNLWAALLASVLPSPQPASDPHAPGPFAFADPERVEKILDAAGWGKVAFEPVDYAMIAGEGPDAVEEAMAYFQRIGPAARALTELPPSKRESASERLRSVLARHCSEDRVSLPAAAWIVTANAP